MKARSFGFLGAGLAASLLWMAGCDSSSSGGGTTTVATPTFTPNGGTFTASQDVTVASATSGAAIYYTMTSDGSDPADPTAASTAYGAAISLDVPATGSTTFKIKAIATHSGMTASAVASATFVLSAPVLHILEVANFDSDTPGTTTYPIINSGGLTAPVVAMGNVKASDSTTLGGSTGNTTANCAEVGSTDYNQYLKLPLTLPAGTTLSDYEGVYVEGLFPDNASASPAWQGDNTYKYMNAFVDTTITDGYHDPATAIGTSSTWSGSGGTAWKKFFIAFDPTKAAAKTGTSFEIALGVSRKPTTTPPAPYYLDTIRLLPKAGLVRDFESDVAGTTTYPILNSGSPGLNASVVLLASIGTTTGNASTNVLTVQDSGYAQYPKFPLTLPAGGALSDYAGAVVKAVFPSNGGDNQYKNIYVFVDTTLSGYLNETTRAMGASPQTGGYTSAWKEFFIPFDDTKAAAVTGTSLEIALGINCSGATGPYYVDDVALIRK